MLQPKSIDDCLFLNYDIKAEYLYEEYDLNRYMCLLIKRFGIINNLRKVCSKSISSCLSRYLILKEMSIKGIDIEKYNIEGEFKIQFCKDLLNKITSLCLNELENIAHIEYGIDLKNSKFEMYGNNAIINDNGRCYEVSLVEGKLYTNYYSILIGEDKKIDTYLDWVGEVIELERSKK